MRFDLEISRGFGRKLWERKHDFDVDAIPWSTLDPNAYPAELVARARVGWTENAYNEYCTAAALGNLVTALLETRAPVDMVGLAAAFAAEEMLHVELCARVAMCLGGGAGFEIDFSDLYPAPPRRASPLMRAAELMVRLCCVGEAMSFPLLSGALKSATHPVTRGVLEQIVRDEAHHGRLGYDFLVWAKPQLTARDRARLGKVAEESLRTFLPIWRNSTSTAKDGVTDEGFLVAHVRELGWMEASAYRELAETVIDDVIARLAEHDITVRRP